MLKRKSFRGIDSSENLAQTSSGAVEIERDLVAVANQAMGADGEPMAVDLKTVAEPRLYDSSALADLGNQPVGIGNLLIVEASEVGSDDRAQQQATKMLRDSQKIKAELQKVKDQAARQNAVLRRKAAEAVSKQKQLEEKQLEVSDVM